MFCWWITWDNSSEVLSTVRNMADTPPVLVAKRRFENPGNHRNNKVSRLRRGNRNYSHGSYAFSHHPLQIAHEKHSNSHNGWFQNAITVMSFRAWRRGKSHGSERIRWRKGALCISQRITECFALFCLGEKSLQPRIPKILIFSETLLCLYILIPWHLES